MEFTIIDRFKGSSGFDGHQVRLGGSFNGSENACLGLPGSALGIRLVSLASEQMCVRGVSDGLLTLVRRASYVLQILVL